MKKSFGIITALFVLVLVSFLLMLVLKASSVSIKHVGNSYLDEQADLFMQTTIENDIMAIEGYQRSNDNGCLEHINFLSSDKRFESNTTVLRYYCPDLQDCPNCPIAEKIDTNESNGTVVLKVVVSTTDNPRNNGKKLRIERITLQKP